MLLLVSGLGATAAVEYDGYTNPAGDKFPIAIYDNVLISTPDCKQFLSDAEQKAYFDTIRMAGFNVELWGKEDIWRKEPVNKWGPYLKSIGMNTIISTRGFSLTRSKIPYDANTPDSILLQDNWDGLRTVISNYSHDPNVWGYWSCDEPTPRNWGLPAYELNTDEVAVIPTFNLINKYKGDKVPYANFVGRSNEYCIGHFATDNTGNSYVENFENYLDYMVDLLNLKFLTFDLYPVISNTPGVEPAWIIKRDYYNMMDLYGRYCRDRKIPVWLMMLSVEHSYDGPGEENDWTYPEITEGLLRMQAMNGLAFGMKGLVYWEYGAQNKWSGNTLYKSALYDIENRHKTPAWEAARYVNCEVAQYGEYLQKASYRRSCLAMADSIKTYEGFPEMSGPFECVDSVKYYVSDVSDVNDDSDVALKYKAGVLLSHFTGDNGDYIAVVNQDHVNSSITTLHFDKNINNHQIVLTYFPAEVYSIYNPVNPSFGEINVGPTVTLALKPGGMALFRYKYKNK